jgi:peroxiredoxin
MALATGEAAPDFELKNQDNEAVKLSDFRGEKAVALVFVPFAFTGVCTGEFCELSNDIADFEAKGVQVLGITCDRPFSNKAWAEAEGITFPVLSDGWPHGEVSKAYDNFNEDLGCAMRKTVIIDKEGVVVEIFASTDLGTPREKAAYEAAVAKLG